MKVRFFYYLRLLSFIIPSFRRWIASDSFYEPSRSIQFLGRYFLKIVTKQSIKDSTYLVSLLLVRTLWYLMKIHLHKLLGQLNVFLTYNNLYKSLSPRREWNSSRNDRQRISVEAVNVKTKPLQHLAGPTHKYWPQKAARTRASFVERERKKEKKKRKRNDKASGCHDREAGSIRIRFS